MYFLNNYKIQKLQNMIIKLLIRRIRHNYCYCDGIDVYGGALRIIHCVGGLEKVKNHKV